ncbi:hypothetical protein FB107DRAFT_288079 [Schizophyllum commune]
MHELFYIPELIGLICEALRLDSFSHRNDPHAARKALATLARTAKVFREPALSSLWYTQHTLVNLVKVLPHFLWREQHYTVRVLKASRLRHELSVSRTPTREEAARLVFYAAFVKELYMGYDPRVSIDFDYDFIHVSPYFDYLQLRLLSFSSDAIRCAQALVRPSLQAIELHGQWDAPNTRDALRTVKTVCRSLGSVRLHTTMSAPLESGVDPGAQELADFVVGFPLRQLRTSGRIADAGLQYLARLSTLTSLEFTESAPGQGFPRGSFSALRELKVICTSHAFALSLFAAMDRCPLETLHCHSTSACSTPHLHAILTELARGVHPRTLTQVAFSCNHFEDDERPRDDNLINLPIIAPLRVFRRLTHVCVTSLDGCRFTDEELAEIGSWWPRATCITLPGCNHARGLPHATIRGVLALARQTPQLKELDVVFDMRCAQSALADVRAMVHCSGPQESLSSLGVGSSPITAWSPAPSSAPMTGMPSPKSCGRGPHADPVVQVLRLAFPRLKEVCVADESDGWAGDFDAEDWSEQEEEYRARWLQVNEHLALTQPVAVA